MLRLIQFARTLVGPAVLKGALAAAAIGVIPTAAYARHEHHYRLGFGPFHFRVTVGDGPVEGPFDVAQDRPEQVAVPEGYRQVRHWVPPVYEMVSERQWVEPVYRTVVDHVWVPEHEDVHWEGRGRRAHRERVIVPGHYEDVSRQEIVTPGHYEDVQRQELVTPGHWETHLEPVAIVPR